MPNTELPPLAESDMQRHFVGQPASAHETVLTLDAARRQPGVARSIEVLLAPEDLPVLRHPEPVKSSVPRNSGPVDVQREAMIAAARWMVAV